MIVDCPASGRCSLLYTLDRSNQKKNQHGHSQLPHFRRKRMDWLSRCRGTEQAGVFLELMLWQLARMPIAIPRVRATHDKQVQPIQARTISGGLISVIDMGII
jgi:hypothetical protein